MELDEQLPTDKSNLGGSIMTQLIDKIYRILNACKGFTAGYTALTQPPMAISTLSTKARLTQ